MAKSIGTLKAMLVLDSKGFLGGFTKASQATKTGMRDIERQVDRTAGVWVRWNTALRAARMAMRGLVSEVMKFRETSPIVNAAVESFFDLGRALRENFLHPLMEATAPAFTFVFESAIDGINQTGEALHELGLGFSDVGNAAMAVGGIVGNAFKVMGSGIASGLAMLQEAAAAIAQPLAKRGWAGAAGFLAATGGGNASLDARQRGIEAQGKWLEAMGDIAKILSGDLSVAMPKRGFRAFVPAMGGAGGRGEMLPRFSPSRSSSQDLEMGALERGTTEAMQKILGIQRPGQEQEHQKKVETILSAIQKNTEPNKKGDTLQLFKLGGR